jgi:hypothetical protein
MQNKYITVSQQVKELYKLGVSSYDIVNHIVDDWDLSVIKATVMVDYVLDKELYPKENETIGELDNE